MTEEADSLKRNMQKVKSERDSSQRSYTKEVHDDSGKEVDKKQVLNVFVQRGETALARFQVTMLERDLRMKEQNFEVKLQSVEDAHRQAMVELRQMLAAQQRMSAKWVSSISLFEMRELEVLQWEKHTANPLRSTASSGRARGSELRSGKNNSVKISGGN